MLLISQLAATMVRHTILETALTQVMAATDGNVLTDSTIYSEYYVVRIHVLYNFAVGEWFVTLPLPPPTYIAHVMIMDMFSAH